MNKLLDKIFFRTNNLDYIAKDIKKLTEETSAKKIFDAINNFSSNSEIRYVGGCIRKIINKEKVDDIDLATNLNPKDVCEALKRNEINFYETGVEHGTITAIDNNYKFEITSLREDISTDGRHAEVKFTNDWKKDAARRDFTINSIYSDMDGNLFDPFNGKKDLKEGRINFIGQTEKRVSEDFLRILRYFRFFLNYSKEKHNIKTLKILKKNIDGISRLSNQRLLDELKKFVKSKTLEKLSNDKLSLEFIQIIFPQLTNLKIFNKPNFFVKNKLEECDFIFLLSLMIIDGTDNTDYFIYKFDISKKDKKRLKFIDNFYKSNLNNNSFSEKNLNKVFYFYGKEAVIDIIGFRASCLKKNDKKLIELLNKYNSKIIPTLPITARDLMNRYNIPEGKILGNKLKIIEEEWVKNNFQLSNKQLEKIIDC